MVFVARYVPVDHPGHCVELVGPVVQRHGYCATLEQPGYLADLLGVLDLKSVVIVRVVLRHVKIGHPDLSFVLVDCQTGQVDLADH